MKVLRKLRAQNLHTVNNIEYCYDFYIQEKMDETRWNTYRKKEVDLYDEFFKLQEEKNSKNLLFEDGEFPRKAKIEADADARDDTKKKTKRSDLSEANLNFIKVQLLDFFSI